VVNVPEEPDDDTADLPVVPAARTPAEWGDIFARLPRLLAAIRSAEAALDTLYLTEPTEDASAEVNAAFEAEADQAAVDERKARDHLIRWFASWTDKPTAVVLPDGRVICHTLEADGLALVEPGNVHKP
jgi:hypothetical protein